MMTVYAQLLFEVTESDGRRDIVRLPMSRGQKNWPFSLPLTLRSVCQLAH